MACFNRMSLAIHLEHKTSLFTLKTRYMKKLAILLIIIPFVLLSCGKKQVTVRYEVDFAENQNVTDKDSCIISYIDNNFVYRNGVSDSVFLPWKKEVKIDDFDDKAIGLAIVPYTYPFGNLIYKINIYADDKLITSFNGRGIANRLLKRKGEYWVAD